MDFLPDEEKSTSDSLDPVREALSSPEFPENIASNTSLAFRRNAAFVLLSDFHESVHAAREQAAEVRAVFSGNTPLSSGASAPLNRGSAVSGKLALSDFPPLTAKAGPCAIPNTHGKARKRITPSRVTVSEANAASSSFAEASASGSSGWKHKEVFPALTSRKRGTGDASCLPDSDSPSPCSFLSLSNGRADGKKPVLKVLDVRKESVLEAPAGKSASFRQKTLAPLGHLSKETSLGVEADLNHLLESLTIRRLSSMHAVFIQRAMSSEHSTTEMIVVLAEALCLNSGPEVDQTVRASPARGVFARCGTAYSTSAHLCAHAILTFSVLEPILRLLPSPVVTAIRGNQVLRAFAPKLFSHSPSIPEYPLPSNGLGVAFAEHLSLNGSSDISWDSLDAGEPAAEASTGRLSGNLEASWDKLIDLHRLYRGDNSQIAAGSLNRVECMKTLSDLHPANVDAFAGRFLKVLLESAVPRQDDLDRRARLSLRMTSSRDPSPALRSGRYTAAAGRSSRLPGRDGLSKGQDSYGSGVLLHRIPPAIRTLYHTGSSEAFFLDFLDVVDSSKLNDAMAPRISLALHNFLKDATSAQNEEAFVDAVLLARMAAKLLAVAMHSSNWAFSSHSFSCESTVAGDLQRANKLPKVVSQRRSALSSAVWKSCVDLTLLLHKAIATQHGPTVFAVVTVADVLLRIAAMDSLSSTTDWFTSCLDVLFDLLRSSHRRGEDEFAWLTCTPTIRFAIEDLLLGLPASHAHVPLVGVGVQGDRWFEFPARNWSNMETKFFPFGDERLLMTCLPNLANFKRILSTCSRPGAQAQAKPRRIRPSSTSMSGREYESGSTKCVLLKPSDTACVEREGQAVFGMGLDAPPASDIVGDSAVTREGAVSVAIRRDLWLTFQRGLDKRVRDIAQLVLQRKGSSRAERSVSMKRAAELLLPEIPSSVIEVTAQHCAEVKVDVDTSELRGDGKTVTSEGEAMDSWSRSSHADVKSQEVSSAPLPQLMIAGWSATSPEAIRTILLKTSLEVSHM